MMCDSLKVENRYVTICNNHRNIFNFYILGERTKKPNVPILSTTYFLTFNDEMEALRPMFQHVSTLVREGVIGVAESAHLNDEIDEEFNVSRNKICTSGASVHRNAKKMSEDIDQFRRIQESIRNKGYITHFAIRQILPDVIIDSVHKYDTRRPDKDWELYYNADRARIISFKEQNQQEIEKERSYSQNKHHKILIKTEKNGTCTWVRHSRNDSKSNPIRRRSVYDFDTDIKDSKKKSLNARGA